MNKVLETIMSHKSIRKFKDIKLTNEQITTIIKAAQMAPSSLFMQDYVIIDVSDQIIKDQLNQLTKSRWVKENGLLLIFCSDLHRIREVKEETGIDVNFHDLIPLGVMDYVVTNSKIIDKEFAHVYLHEYNGSLDDFSLQREEVSGMFTARFYDFFDLWMDRKVQIDVHGFFLDSDGKKSKVNKVVGRDQFVPHHETFYKLLVNQIKDVIENSGGHTT